jgi:PAS domain S-box-containing protein
MSSLPRPDKTERIIAAARLHDDGGDHAVIATDDAGKIVYWSNTAESVYGWPASETLGRNIVDITPTNSTVDEAMRIMEQLRQGEPWSGDFILRHRDGRPIYGHVTDVPVLHENVVIGIVGLSRQARRDTPRP